MPQPIGTTGLQASRCTGTPSGSAKFPPPPCYFCSQHRGSGRPTPASPRRLPYPHASKKKREPPPPPPPRRTTTHINTSSSRRRRHNHHPIIAATARPRRRWLMRPHPAPQAASPGTHSARPHPPTPPTPPCRHALHGSPARALVASADPRAPAPDACIRTARTSTRARTASPVRIVPEGVPSSRGTKCVLPAPTDHRRRASRTRAATNTAHHSNNA